MDRAELLVPEAAKWAMRWPSRSTRVRAAVGAVGLRLERHRVDCRFVVGRPRVITGDEAPATT
jgi:hypothetical protein